MRVKCIKILNQTTGQEEARLKNGWITIGKEYLVLAIEISPSRPPWLRIIGDDSGQTPGLESSHQFETVCTRLPSCWQARLDHTGGLDIAPVRWLRPGFWEDYFNGHAEAVAEFKADHAQMLAELNGGDVDM